MPRDFVGQVNTVEPTQVPGTSIGVINPLEGLDTAVNAGAQVLGGIALSGLERDLAAQGTEQDAFLYDQSRELKRKMIEAGQQGNQDAVNRYTAELEKLKIAEKQGVIGPAAVETRRATIAKDYITRFPHLAADIKKIYNTTGGASGGGSSGKEQFKDPIETAQDELLAEYGKMGGLMPFQEFLQIKTTKMRRTAVEEGIDLRVKLGQAAETDLDELALSFRVEAAQKMQVVRRDAILKAQNGGAFDAAVYKASQNAVKEGALLEFRMTMQEKLNQLGKQNSAGDVPIISQDYIKAKEAEIRQVFDQGIEDVQNLDQLKVMTRWNEIRRLQGIENIRSIDDTTAFVLSMSPDKALDVLAEVKKAFEANAAGFLSQVSATSQSPLARTAIEQVKKNPNMTYGAFMNAVIKGHFDDLEVTDPTARAVITRSIRDTAIGNPSVPEEAQDNIAKASYEEEKRATGRDLPVSAWYMRPDLAEKLRSNPELKRMAEQDVATAAVNVVPDLVATGLVGKISYNPQPSLHGSEPWKFYREGGPFTVSPTTGGYAIGNVAGVSAQVGAASKVLTKLNEGWNIVRAAEGEAGADKWANEIMGRLDKKAKDLPEGMVEPGNIDLTKRKVLNNPDGSFSTESSISIGTDKGEVIIPTVVDGKRLTTEQAKEHYFKTGEHLGIFNSVEAADAYAQKVHENQGVRYGGPQRKVVSWDDLVGSGTGPQ